MTPDPNTTCETCGTHTGWPTTICGRCATDWQDGAAGNRRINMRRATNGLPPLQRCEPSTRTPR